MLSLLLKNNQVQVIATDDLVFWLNLRTGKCWSLEIEQFMELAERVLQEKQASKE